MACRRRRRMVRRTKSAAHKQKMVMEAIWKMIPATMMFVPVSVLPSILSASVEAMAPPTAWITRETTSQVTKIQR
jgi:hypothetical protein